ncbi:MAG TPA: TolC family protein [Pyrinomonadaceae bacterium]|nr:TolC family protein [Pyrinomonadaceae bacterium]
MILSARLRTAALALAVALSFCATVTHARQKSRARAKKGAAAQKKAEAPPVSEVARLREQLVQATKEYKASLEQLVKHYEANVKRTEERLDKTRELYKEGLISKSALEADEQAVRTARAEVAKVEGQLKSADVQIAETLVEAEAEEAAAKALAKAKAARRATGGLLTTTAYIRYGGSRAWSINEAGAVMQFFTRSFGRQLPVSSFGQSPVHDRWGYAHHNAMDVGVSPDSAEGRALMEYLRSSGIPFTAFRWAIPGTATGPHIHIGRPSHKITPR